MKSRLLNIAGRVGFELPTLFVLLIVATILNPMVAHAQDTRQIDPESSVAYLSMGSEPHRLETGLARVTGDVSLDLNDPADAIVNLKIVPDEGPKADYDVMSFTSKRSQMMGNGDLAVTGDLTVTHIERSVTVDPTEAYSGAVYGAPTAHTDTRQVTLVLSAARNSGSQNGTKQYSGRIVEASENFPQLLDAVSAGNWPTTLVNNEKCSSTSTIGEDYSGPTCTGTVIASVTNSVTAVGVSSAYSGFEPAFTPDRTQVNIAMGLTLAQPSTPSSVATGTEALDGHMQ